MNGTDLRFSRNLNSLNLVTEYEYIYIYMGVEIRMEPEILVWTVQWVMVPCILRQDLCGQDREGEEEKDEFVRFGF